MNSDEIQKPQTTLPAEPTECRCADGGTNPAWCYLRHPESGDRGRPPRTSPAPSERTIETLRCNPPCDDEACGACR